MTGHDTAPTSGYSARSKFSTAADRRPRRPQAANAARAPAAARERGRLTRPPDRRPLGCGAARDCRQRARRARRRLRRLPPADLLLTTAGVRAEDRARALDLHRFERLVEEGGGAGSSGAEPRQPSSCAPRCRCGAARPSWTSHTRRLRSPRSSGSRSYGSLRSRAGSTPISLSVGTSTSWASCKDWSSSTRCGSACAAS